MVSQRMTKKVVNQLATLSTHDLVMKYTVASGGRRRLMVEQLFHAGYLVTVILDNQNAQFLAYGLHDLLVQLNYIMLMSGKVQQD